MTRGTSLQRSDIKKSVHRNRITLSYRGRVRKRIARLHGQDEDTFFTVNSEVIPLPDAVEELAQRAGMTLVGSPTEASFRELVTDALIAEAFEDAPEHLLAITGIKFEWPRALLVALERETKEREERVDGLTREVTHRLKSKLSERLPMFEWTPVSVSGERREPARPTSHAAPAIVGGQEMMHLHDAFVAARNTEPEPRIAPPPDEAPPGVAVTVPSDAVMQKIRDAMRAARDRDIPQRLPAGARKAVEAAVPGPLVWANGKTNICRSLEDAIGGARSVAVRGVESAVIDWDGEQPVLVRRFAAGGATAYRCEDSIKGARSEVLAEPEAVTLPAEEPTP